MKSHVFLVVALLLMAIGTLVLHGVIAGQTEETATPPPAEQAPADEPTPENEVVAPTEALPISARVLQRYAYTEIQTQVVNGIDMSAANFRYVENDFFKGKIFVDICHLMPGEEEEWYIDRAAIQAGEQTFLKHGFVTLESAQVKNGRRYIFRPKTNHPVEELPDDGLPAYHCATVEFFPYPSLGEGADLSHLTLEVYSLYFSSLESEEEQCTFYLTDVQEALNRDNVGIELACSEPDEWGNVGPVFLTKPEGMSEEEAGKIVWSYVKRFQTIEGPWVFTGSIVLLETNR